MSVSLALKITGGALCVIGGALIVSKKKSKKSNEVKLIESGKKDV